tara:strand:+ start:88 stop:927 length:840 start_codon:yes stop_codon:yes gene_type:complete
MNISDLSNKKIGILGLGYIGSNLSTYLKKFNIEAIEILRENLNHFKGEQFDFFINCAGNSGDFRNNLIETVKSNVNLNTYILENINIKNCYIYPSSTRIYGFSKNEKIIFDENSLNNYNNLSLDYIYDGSKKLTESLLMNYSKKVNYKIAILRISNVYGNFNCLDDSTLIKKIIRYKMESLNNLNVKQNRYSKKDYIHINDVVETIINVILKIKNTDIFNLSCGKSYSLDDISRILNLDIQTDESMAPTYSYISNDKIKKEFSLSFKHDFKSEVKKYGR